MKTWHYAFLSMIPFLIGIVIIAPFQAVFYGGDDWAYAWSVLNFVETSKLEASDWAVASAVPQILWGALFAKAFGGSIVVLNISTIVAAFFAGLAFFSTIVALGFRNSTALLATIVVTVSPLYLGMSFAFMTDGMFTSLTLIAGACYVQAMTNKSKAFALIGGLFCAAAFFNRQFGVVMVIAYALTLFLWYASSSKPQIRQDIFKIFLLGITLPIVGLAVFLFFPEIIGGRTIAQTVLVDMSDAIMRLFDIPKIAIKGLLMFDFLIMLLCPILIPFLLSEPKKLQLLLAKKWLLSSISLSLIAAPLVWYFLFKTGIQGDVFQVNAKYGNNEFWGLLVWQGALLLCILLGTLLITKAWYQIQALLNHTNLKDILKRITNDAFSVAFLFMILYTVGMVVLTSSHIAFYNNYFLPILPFFAICILFVLRDLKQSVFLSTGMVLLLFSVSVLDIESHARYVEASWDEADSLVQSGEKATTVFAWPSWYGWQNTSEIHNFMRDAVDQ